ncbi:MAG: hypothetical protein SFW62_06265 [Alphaproteobacteria bacterium]|nr:hypothetical protein [Alphaproteobacteria bacterium]
MKSVSRFFRSFAPIFQPPFNGLWLVIALYYAWCFLVYPNSQVLRGNFPDPDDYMHLTQALDWLKGQGWYDHIQHRINPPEGIPIHFSRLTQLPMAALIALFKFLGIPTRGAASIMALIYPLMLLAGFFGALYWAAQSFMPKKWAGITAYIALFATATMSTFQPGHVDHHGLIIILTTLALGCIGRMAENPAEKRWAAGAGLLLALGMAVALEILPCVLIIATWVGLWAIVKGGKATRQGFVFGMGFLLGSLCGLLSARPLSDFFTVDILSYSIVYILMAGGIAISLGGVAITASARLWLRGLVGGGLALLTGILFLHHFPGLMAGPYGGLDPSLAQLLLGEIVEAQPAFKRVDTAFELIAGISSLFLGLGAALYLLKAGTPKERWRWGLIAALLLAIGGLAWFYQFRFSRLLGMLTVLPLAATLQKSWAWTGVHWRGRRKVFAEIGLLLLVGPLPGVLIPALVDGRSLNSGVLLFPAYGNRELCDTYVLEQVLRDPRFYGDRPRLIMNTLGIGPELLFRTPHAVISAPYLNVTGNMDATRFFSTPYPAEAEAIARRRHVDLVIACTKIPQVYIRPPGHAPNQKPTPDFAPHFIERLLMGTTPGWLKRAQIPALKNFVIYEVLPPNPDTSSPAKPE